MSKRNFEDDDPLPRCPMGHFLTEKTYNGIKICRYGHTRDCVQGAYVDKINKSMDEAERRRKSTVLDWTLKD